MSRPMEPPTAAMAAVENGLAAAGQIIDVWIDYLRRSDQTFTDYLVFLKGVAAEHSTDERDMMLLVALLRLLEREQS